MGKRKSWHFDQTSPRAKTLLGMAGIVLLVCIVYLPVVNCGFVWDDDPNVTGNSNLLSWHGLSQTWTNPIANQQYYPLTHTSFWIEYHLWELEPLGYHIDNVLLHALGAVLLWFILQQLSLPGAWLAAAVWAIHPINVESVAWVTERKNTLSGVFYFSALLAYLRYAGIGDVKRAGSLKVYALALMMFACALLSKTATAMLPVVVLIVLWWKKDRLTRRQVLSAAPFFAMSFAMGLVTTWRESKAINAGGAHWTLPFAGKLIEAGESIAFYAGKLLCPTRMVYIYPRWRIDPGDVRQYVYPLMAVALPVILWTLRKKIGKAPVASILYFEVTLLPAIGFINQYFTRYSYVQDHFQYLAGIGVIALAAGLLTTLLRRAGRLGIAMQAIVLVTLAVLSVQQIPKYHDEETLWLDTVAKNPSAYIALSNLGRIAYYRGDSEEATSYFIRAMKADPSQAEPHCNLGVSLFDRGNREEAFKEFRKAAQLDPMNIDAHNNLAMLYYYRGDGTNAWKEVKTCRKLGFEPDPTFLADLILLKDEP